MSPERGDTVGGKVFSCVCSGGVFASEGGGNGNCAQGGGGKTEEGEKMQKNF